MSIWTRSVKVQDLLEICKELGITVGPAKRKQRMLTLIEAEEVTVEEAQKAYEAIFKPERPVLRSSKRRPPNVRKGKELELRMSAERYAGVC